MPPIIERPRHLEHGGKDSAPARATRTYAIAEWPAAAWWGFWQPLLRLRTAYGRALRVRIALHAHPYPTSFWSREQGYRVRRLRAEAEAQRVAGAPWRANELEASAAALEALKGRETEGAAMFRAAATVTVSAPTTTDLDADCATVADWAEARGLKLATVPYTQLPAYMAAQPTAAPTAPATLPHRILDDEALAALVPAQDGPWGGRGVYAGVRVADGAFVTLPLDDPRMEAGTNIVLLGETGSGKSFYAKALLTGMLLSGFRVVVFDVDGEFRSWCDAWGGGWVDHTPGSGRYVEPMRIAPRSGGYAEMAARVAAVVSLLVGAGGLDALGENVVDKVTATTCRLAGVDPADEATWNRPMRLRDWYAVLAALSGWEVAATPGAAGGAARAGAALAGTAGAAAIEGKPSARQENAGAHRRQGTTGGRGADAAVGEVQSPIEAAVLALVRRDPSLGERAIARALEADGATQGRVYRILQRRGLGTAAMRRQWAAGAGAQAAGGDPQDGAPQNGAPQNGVPQKGAPAGEDPQGKGDAAEEDAADAGVSAAGVPGAVAGVDDTQVGGDGGDAAEEDAAGAPGAAPGESVARDGGNDAAAGAATGGASLPGDSTADSMAPASAPPVPTPAYAPTPTPLAALPTLPPQLLAVARDLAARLEPYFAGGLAHVFQAEDAVDFAAPLTVVHAADADDADSRLGALKMLLDGAAVREMLEAEGRSGRRYTAVYFEEGQRLLQNAHMRRYVADLFTAIRKRNGMAMLATNSTQALFERDGDVTKAGPIWQNARGKVLLAMSREAVEDVKGHGTMPEGVVRLLEGLRAADHAAVLEWDGRHEVVRMDVPSEEAEMYRTRGVGGEGRATPSVADEQGTQEGRTPHGKPR